MRICMYGASSDLIDEKYIKAGEVLGRLLGERGHDLLFGAGASGMMGAAARGIAPFAKEGSSRLIGVAPRFFDTEGVLYKECTEMVFTETMRERKEYLELNSDAFIVSPGGIGTFEEFFEVYTLKQIGQLDKKIVLLNIDGYYEDMMTLLTDTAEKGFLTKENLELVKLCDTPEEALDYIDGGK